MRQAPFSSVLSHLRAVTASEALKKMPDAQLVERFLAQRDESAFAVIVRRHARLVWTVCRNVLQHEQDVEDALQASFLVLATQAGSIQKRQSLASWLHGVAFRTAMLAKRRAAVQRNHEKAKPIMSPANGDLEPAWKELLAVLDAEVRRLPEKYGAPFILCCLEGRTGPEAAKELGWKVGTVTGRLAQARKLLQQRLVRRGIDLGLVLGGLAVAQQSATAIGASRLAIATLRGAELLNAGEAATDAVTSVAVTLAKGVVKAMFLSKLKTGVGMLVAMALIAVGGVGLAAWMDPTEGSQQPSPQPQAKPAAVAQKQPQPTKNKLPTTDVNGDPLPAGAVARLGTQRWRHGQGIVSVTWSPDGNWIASAGGDNDSAVRLWDSSTGKEISQFLGHSNGSRTVAIAALGKVAVSHDKQGTLFAWDTITGKTLIQKKMGPNPSYACLLALVGDGKKLVALDEKGKVCLIDTVTLKTVRSFTAAGSPPVVCLAVSKDGKVVATADTFMKIRLYDVDSGKLLQTMLSSSQVECLALSPDRRLIASGAKDKTIVVWNAGSGKEVRVLEGHTGSVRSIAFMPDGQQLLSGSDDGLACLWDVINGVQVRRFPENRTGLLSVAPSPDGKLIAAGGGGHKVRIWEADSGKELFPEDGHVNYMSTVTVLADGKTILTCAADDYVRLWDRHTGQLLDRIFAPHAIRRPNEQRSLPKSVTVSADRKLLAVGAEDGAIRLLELPGGKQLAQFKKVSDPIHAVVFSPDGKLLVSHTTTGKSWLWDVATREPLRDLRHPSEPMESMVFAPDSRSLWLGSTTGKIYLWDTAEDREIGRLPAHKSNVQDIVVSPDGTLVASLSKDATIRVFDMASATQLRQFKTQIGINGPLAFSPDGRLLATGEGRGLVRLLEIASGQVRTTLPGHRGAVSALTFCPDGKTLVSGGADTTCLLWDLTDSPSTHIPPVKPLTAAELEGAWRNLGSKNADQAYQSMLKLARYKTQALDKLQKELKPIQLVDVNIIAKWIAELDDKQFAIREKAMDGLRNADDLAWPALKKVLDNPPSLEAQNRVRQLFSPQADLLVPTAQRLKLIRALELLERMATPEARALVRTLAEGAPEAWLTLEAKAIQKRLQ